MNVSGNIMNLQHFHDFYYLEALKAGLTMAKSANPDYQFRHSVERLERDIDIAFEHLTTTMAKRIFVYIWAACLGEARHARGFVGLSIKELSSNEDRTSVYNRVFKYEPTQEHMNLVRDVYAQDGWGSTFGGQKWLEVTEGMMMYNTVNHATFIDHAVDLEHNGGNIFTKHAKAVLMDVYKVNDYSAMNLRRFLDYKFSHDILNQGHYDTVRVSSKVYRLVTRYSNIIEHIKAVDFLTPELEWLSEYTVEWGDSPLTAYGEASSEASERRYDDTCQNCGNGIHSWSHYHNAYDDCLCRSCYEEWKDSMTTCDNCGDDVPKDDTHYVNSIDQNWCDYCHNNYEATCKDCNKEYHTENTVTSEDDVTLCEDCAENHTCGICDKVYHDMETHDEEAHSPVSLPVDGDGVFESFDDYKWMDEDATYLVSYKWNHGLSEHTVFVHSLQAAKAQVETLKTAGAIAKMTKIEYPATCEYKDFQQGLHHDTITQDVLNVSDGLWVYNHDNSGQWVMMTLSGLWVKNTKDSSVNGALKMAHAVKGILDWSKITTAGAWEAVDSDTKKLVLAHI